MIRWIITNQTINQSICLLIWLAIYFVPHLNWYYHSLLCSLKSTRKNAPAHQDPAPSPKSPPMSFAPIKPSNSSPNPCISSTIKTSAPKSKPKTASQSISPKEAGKTPSLSNALKSNCFCYEEEVSKSQKIKATWFLLNESILSIKSPKLKLLTWKVKTSTKGCISLKKNSAKCAFHKIFRSYKLKSIFMKLSKLLSMSLFNLCRPFLTNFIPCTLHPLKNFSI